MAQEEIREYPIYRGLQKPLEFLGLQGRYITWGAITTAVGLIGFMVVYIIFGFVVGLVFAAVAFSTGIGMIIVKQRRGLHTKKVEKGIFVYSTLTRL
jgi:hypothetical protein